MADEIFEYELIDISFEFRYRLPEEDSCCRVREDGPEEKPIPAIVYDADGIPMGNSHEEIEQRRKIVHEYIQQWRNTHENKRIFNEDLNDYIRINHLFLLESVSHSVDNYYSTKAVLHMEEIMTKAKYIGDSKKKNDVTNQKSFEKMVIMLYKSEELGNVKMTVGVMRRTQEKIEYSITVPTPHTPFIEEKLKLDAKSKKKKKHHK